MANVEAAAPIITSPVPGISLELASYLITAIKSRRKYLSKFSTESTERLKTLEESADDSTTAFIVQLRKAVEAAKSKQSSKKDNQQLDTTNAATHCLGFLLTTLSESDNSFHLRRAALIICKEILQRSADARAYLDRGGALMDFVSVIQRIDGNEDGSNSNPAVSSKRLFQQDAIELIKYLSDKFGAFYPKFNVASRLMDDISVACFDVSSSNGEQPQMLNMKTLRIERDVALRKGSKACDFLERMIDRVDECFRVLVPRYGGFNQCSSGDLQQPTDQDRHDKAADENHSASQPGCNEVYIDACGNNDDEAIENNDDSVDWEEGDAEASAEVLTGTTENDSQSNQPSHVDHHEAVSHTLDVMQRSGLLQEGGLSLELGSSMQSPTGSANDDGVQVKLKALVEDLSTRRLTHLNKWINALSRADGMEERVVADPTTVDGAGPVSLVLISEEKRALRGPLLKR